MSEEQRGGGGVAAEGRSGEQGGDKARRGTHTGHDGGRAWKPQTAEAFPLSGIEAKAAS